MQGRPSQPHALQQLPVTLTLKMGSNETNYSSRTDANGFFTVIAPGPGTYNWRVKTDQTLANSGSVTLAAGGNSQEMGLLLTGDASDDNCVSVSDFNIVKGAFGTSLGDLSYDAQADFTGDNAITITDFNLLKNNFSFCGAGLITPGSGR